jgi:hypothetical protein
MSTGGKQYMAQLLHRQALSPSARKEFCELKQGQAYWYVDTELKKVQVTYRWSIRLTVEKKIG